MKNKDTRYIYVVALNKTRKQCDSRSQTRILEEICTKQLALQSDIQVVTGISSLAGRDKTKHIEPP